MRQCVCAQVSYVNNHFTNTVKEQQKYRPNAQFTSDLMTIVSHILRENHIFHQFTKHLRHRPILRHIFMTKSYDHILVVVGH